MTLLTTLAGGTLRGQAGLRRAPLALAVSLALSACAVTPPYQTPTLSPQQAQAGYLAGDKAGAASSDAGGNASGGVGAHAVPPTQASEGHGGEAQHFVMAADIPGEWWTLYHSPALDQLVRQALANNPSLAAAQASLRQAEETYKSTQAGLFMPNVTGNLQGGRERLSQASTGLASSQTYNLYNASVSVSYTLDVFGANAQALEAQRASLDYQRFQTQAADLSLTANVVTTAVREASLREQVAATQDLLQAEQEQLQALQGQLRLGGVAMTAVLAQRSVIAATQASLPALQNSLSQARNQLAVYTGRAPAEDGLPHIGLDELSLPQALPLSLPTDLVRQRPDVRASEAQLHQAAAQLGVASANLYPQFTLTGTLGSSAFKTSELFDHNWTFWNLLGGVTQPLFDGGALSAKKRAAQAGYEAAAAQYRNAVLLAFANVADSLRALEFDALTLKQQVEAESLARQTLALSQQQYRLGALSYLSLLDAQRSYQQARLSLVSARAARYADTAALFQALGGGWWNRATSPQSPQSTQSPQSSQSPLALQATQP